MLNGCDATWGLFLHRNTVSASGKDSIKLPAGYHGNNAFTSPAALSKAGLPCKDSLEYGLELVKEIKNN
ncbi:hypothetical protein NC652_009994 [Populus alba x Populus x berolinensis]|nr:hypothetical protein NC652_009994 [Populus alba x Populus x berolinensis]